MIDKASTSKKNDDNDSKLERQSLTKASKIQHPPPLFREERIEEGEDIHRKKYSEEEIEKIQAFVAKIQRRKLASRKNVIPKSPGRPKTSENLRKDNKILLSLNDEDFEELKRLQNILGKKTLTSTVEYFLQLGITKMREDFLSASEKK